MSRKRIWAVFAIVYLAVAVGLLPAEVTRARPESGAGNNEPGWPAVNLTRGTGGLDLPVQIAEAGDGSGRLFVVEQRGRVRIVQNGTLLTTPFLDITDRVSCCGERGLLSVAFPPSFADTGRFYVNYTDLSGDTVVARYHLGAQPDVADASSEQIVLTVNQPYANHNGGQLAFGPGDGFLYVGMGDGGSAGDPQDRAQDPSSLLGKLLRIDVETGNPQTYTVPATNPYTQTVGFRPEIWALGLRNPWRFSFDPDTGDLFIGDVGQNRYEEVDYQPAASRGGENYGWRIMEGSHCFEPPVCNPSGLVLPVAEYGHGDGNCSISGGVVYRGGDYPDLDGIYLFADYCSGRIWGLKQNAASWQSDLLYDAPFRITGFGADEAGNIWLTEYAGAPDGALHRVIQVRATAHLPLLPK